jgi:hypothetical protein
VSAGDFTPSARRRPGLVALLFAHRALAGLLIALPVSVAVGAPAANYPRGGAELFDPGGLMLIESTRLIRRAVMPLLFSGGAVALLAAATGLFPLGMLIAGLGREGRLSAGFVAGRAWKHAGTMALLWGAGMLAQALLAAIGSLAGGKLIGALKLVAPGEDIAFVVLFAVVLGIMIAVGVLRDLAWVAAVHGEHRFYVACVRALRCARMAGVRALGAYAWRGALGLGAVVLAARLAPPLAGASTAMLAVGVLVHQAGIAGAVFARASWLAAAIGLLDKTAPVPAPAPVPVPVPVPVPFPVPDSVPAPAPVPDSDSVPPGP